MRNILRIIRPSVASPVTKAMNARLLTRCSRKRQRPRRPPRKLPKLPHTRALLSRLTLFAFAAVALIQAGNPAQNATKITTPKEALGFNLGDDYQVANYTRLDAYWHKLASESDRMKLVDIGPTAENRRQYMAIISAPETIKRLDHYKDISRRLARAEGLTDEQAHALAHEGKAVVWIDGGLHASEA